MASTGYGRTSSLNRIQYYKGSNSRTYRGVKTPKMVADMSLRMQKAQDTATKDSFNSGQMSTDGYISYLTNRIASTSDPTYRNTLTQELQTVTVTDNEKVMTQGYADGTVTAGQLESYYQNKLAGLDPNSQEYQTTQNDIAKWTKTANQDAYKSQEAVLKEQYNGAADKLDSAQKLLDFYVQQTQTLTPGTPDYNTAVQNVGTYQAEVRKISFEQQLLKAEDTISQTYAKDTPENWQAKAQAYAQLRDSAASQGDITNFYKYDQLANTATDNVATSQAKVVSKQVNDAIKQTQADYLSGKIDGATAQDQMQQIADAALQANDTNGVIVAHDYYNKIQNDLAHGVAYGGDNGFGKTKGGTGGDSGWFDGTSGTPIGSLATPSSVSTHTGGTSSSPVPSSTKAVSNLKTTTSGATATINNLDQVLNAAKFTNPTTAQLSHLSMIQDAGGTTQDMILYLRTQKIGTGDGWTALQQTYDKDMQEINQKALEGYDPSTGQAFTAVDAAKAIRGEQTAMAALYMAWGNVASQNPNMKINIDGVNTKVGTLTKTIDEKLNGKVDDQTGLIKKGAEGFLTEIAKPLNAEDAILVQDKNNPAAFISTTRAVFDSGNDKLNKGYVQDSSDPNRYFFVNNNDQASNKQNFNNQQSAQQAANKFNVENKDAISRGLIQAVTPVQNGAQWTVDMPNMEARTTTVFGPNGQSITYVLDGANNPISAVTSSKGILPQGYTPKSVMSFGAARESVPAGTMGFKLQGQAMSQPTQSTPANTSTRYGARYTSQPTQPQVSFNPNGSANTSTRFGNAYTTPANTSTINGPRYTAGPITPPQDNRISVTGAINNSLFASNPLLNNPIEGVLARPIDQLIQNAFNLKPLMNIAPASVIPVNTPLRTSSGNVSFPQQTQQPSQSQPTQSTPAPQQSPSAPSAPLSVITQPQNNMQSYVQKTNTPQIPISGPSIPASPAPENLFTNIGNAVSSAWNGAGNAINSGLNSAANFLGGFKF